MGGTSLDASLIVDGEPVLTRDAKFEGLPISLAGAGHQHHRRGRRLDRLDGRRRPPPGGPAERGRRPGPRGLRPRRHAAPPFTDAALVAGLPGHGHRPRRRAAPWTGRWRGRRCSRWRPRWASRAEAVAAGILRITTTQDHGRRARDHRGARPRSRPTSRSSPSAAAAAWSPSTWRASWAMPTVIVPPGPGAFCAFGHADGGRRPRLLARTWVTALDDARRRALRGAYRELEARRDAGAARRRLRRRGRAQLLTGSADLRYQGQEHSVNIALPADGWTPRPSPAARGGVRRRPLSALRAPRWTTPSRSSRCASGASGAVAAPGAAADRAPAGGSRRRHRGHAAASRWTGIAHDYEVVAAATSLPRATVIAGPAIVGGAHRHHRAARGRRRPGRRRAASWSSPSRRGRAAWLMSRLDSITVEVIRHRLLSAAAGDDAQPVPHGAQHDRLRDPRLRPGHLRRRRARCSRRRPGLAIFTRANDYGAGEGRSSSWAPTNIEPGDCHPAQLPLLVVRAHPRRRWSFSPIHHDGRADRASRPCRIHWLDLKQKNAGYVLDCTDMHQEGIFFPCTKI